MPPKTKTISVPDDVADVLRRSATFRLEYDGPDWILKLPDQLDRALYIKTDKILRAAGGRWNRGKGGHLFKQDPMEQLLGAAEDGAIVNVKVTRQAFYTPASLLPTIYNHVPELRDGRSRTLLEPSAGEGSLAVSAMNHGFQVTCIEIDPDCCQKLANEGLGVLNIDFLTLDAPLADAVEYSGFHAVLMNPPFTNGQDVEHVTHALRFLRAGGVLAAIMSSGVIFRSDRRTTAFRELLNDADDLEWESHTLPEGSFRESGTMVQAVLIVVRRADR